METKNITLNSDLKRVFSWLSRSGMGRKFGTLPIGWYQMHQCAAMDVIRELLKRSQLPEDAELRTKFGHVQALGPAPLGRGNKRQWRTLASVIEVFQTADNKARA